MSGVCLVDLEGGVDQLQTIIAAGLSELTDLNGTGGGEINDFRE